MPRRTNAEMEKARMDGWTNLLTKVGVQNRDKRISSTVEIAPIFQAREELDDLYHGNDLANRICTLPAVECLRHWIEFKLGDEDKDKNAEASKAVAGMLETLKAQKQVTDALIWSRLFGGSIVFIGADDGQDPSMPLDLKRVQTIRFLTVYDRYEVRIAQWVADTQSDNYGEPELYEIINPATPTAALLGTSGVVRFGQKIHASRVLSFEGSRTSRVRKRRVNSGWADSVFVRLFSIIRAYDGTWDSAEVLMQDFAQAVIKIKGLADQMAAHGEDAVMSRLELMDVSRSVLRSLLIDADSEDFKREPTPLTGMPELMDRWLYRVSAAAEIPVNLLFGRSSSGLNATGEEDTRYFYDMVKAKQETELKPQIEKLLTILLAAKDGPTGGVEPQDWSFEFCNLWQMSDNEKAELHAKQAEADERYFNMGVVSADELASSRFGGDSYGVETYLDEEARSAYESSENLPPDQASALVGGKGAADVQKTALNGAQVTSLLEMVKAVALKDIPRDAAVAMIAVSFQLDPAEADKLLGSTGMSFFAEKPEPAPAPGGFPKAPANGPQE